ncbi:hypothetical protein HPP92_001336 [Vanilla planifolia]|uniref:Protein SAMBA n=1 Tax=Vanilla planifolia TaxID=51239 RepID=A0A835VHW1_VANPL|nr:hypothetical protein HPP92_001521 [Vanilla planifolia]KAG0501264.1 hypothetical protein HPP92_001336 [Vanilla planifolia]
MSSPARSSASGTSAGQSGGGVGSSNAGLVDDTVYHFPTDLISVHDLKDAALSVLRSDLMAALQKNVKSLDEDSWKFSGPRSQIHLVLRPGSHPHMQSTKHVEENQFKQQIR